MKEIFFFFLILFSAISLHLEQCSSSVFYVLNKQKQSPNICLIVEGNLGEEQLF